MKKPKAKHTPIPWKQAGRFATHLILPDGALVDCPHKDAEVAIANAAFIIRAVNSHEQLVDLHRNIIREICILEAYWESGDLANAVRDLAKRKAEIVAALKAAGEEIKGP